MQAKKQQLELDMDQQTGSKLGKEYIKAVYCHVVYLTYMQNTSCEMWADEVLAGVKIAERTINNLRFTDDTTLMAESEGLKSLLMKVREEIETQHSELTSWHLAPLLQGKQMGKQWKQ